MANEVREALADVESSSITQDFVQEFKKDWKINLNHHNSWLDLKDAEIFLMCPRDELHHWWLGVFDHLVKAITERYCCVILIKLEIMSI